MQCIQFPQLLITLFFVCAVSCTQMVRLSLHNYELVPKASDSDIQEALYLPSGKSLAFFAAGFTNVLSDVLWFRTINYFGREFRSEQKYTFLEHYVHLAVDLNPRAEHIYQFGALMFAWELHKPDASIHILNKGVAALPNSWLLLYYRGFMHLHFKKDAQRALSDFTHSAALPNAPALINQLADKIRRTTSLDTQDDVTLEIDRDARHGLGNITSDEAMQNFIQGQESK